MNDVKNFNGKAIYNPSGKAGEYAEWACNFYAGCSNGCEYCYLTKGWSAKTYEHRYPKLKAGFRDEKHALEVFEKELIENLEELRQHGLFFSFTTDPLLEETIKLTSAAVYMCLIHDVPVKVLTKRAGWINGYKCGNTIIYFPSEIPVEKRNMVAFGFTLTGHDELESGASTNAERIEAMKKLHNAGFRTFASIEPIVDIESSKLMIENTMGNCDLYKVGLMSGGKYSKRALQMFLTWMQNASGLPTPPRFYLKDSFVKRVGINRENLPSSFVTTDYNIFNIK